MYSDFYSKLITLGDKPNDSAAEKLKHRILIYLGLAMSMGGISWSLIFIQFELYFQTIVPLCYPIITIINLWLFWKTKNFQRARFIQILISLLLPFLSQWGLGGFILSGSAMLWAMIALIISAFVGNIYQAVESVWPSATLQGLCGVHELDVT